MLDECFDSGKPLFIPKHAEKSSDHGDELPETERSLIHQNTGTGLDDQAKNLNTDEAAIETEAPLKTSPSKFKLELNATNQMDCLEIYDAAQAKDESK